MSITAVFTILPGRSAEDDAESDFDHVPARRNFSEFHQQVLALVVMGQFCSTASAGIPMASLSGVTESQSKASGEQQVTCLLPWRRVAEVIIVERGLPTQEPCELGNQAQAESTAKISRGTQVGVEKERFVNGR